MSTNKARMRRLGYLGGTATKEKMRHDPDYYFRISKLGVEARAGKPRTPRKRKRKAVKGPDVAAPLAPSIAEAVAELDA